MKIGDRIRSLREKMGYTQEELAKKLGYASRSSVNKIENSRELSNKKVEQFAKALNTTPAYLMGWEDENSVFRYSDAALPRANNVHAVQLVRIPKLGAVAAGTPIYSKTSDEFESIDAALHVDYCLDVVGSSMEPLIHDGDTVYVRKQPSVDNGQIAVVIIDEEATLKRFYKNGSSVQLISINPAFPPIILTGTEDSNIHIDGLAVSFKRKLI